MPEPTPASILSGAAESIRQFNHASISTNTDWHYPSNSYDAIGNLAHLARMLPQAIEQASRPASWAYENGRLLVGGAGDPHAAIGDLVAAMADAYHHAERLAVALDVMHTAAASMGMDTTGLPDDANATTAQLHQRAADDYRQHHAATADRTHRDDAGTNGHPQ